MPLQETLKAMGVAVLQPRFVFPAAKPSPVFEAESPAIEPAVPQSQAQQPENEVKHDFTWLREQVGETEPQAAAVNHASGQALRFRLRMQRFGALLMVVDQPMLEWQQQQTAHAFFADIHFFLLDQHCEDFQDLTFNWPPGKNFPLADDADCARQTLAGFIRELPVQWVLLWGERASQNVLDQTADYGEVVLTDEYRLLQLHSLDDYWQQPSSKKLLWQHLQAIKKQANQ